MRCEDAQAWFLAGERTEQVDRHLAGCPTCRIERRGLELIAAGLADPVTWEEPGPDVENLVLAEIERLAHPAASGRRGGRAAVLSGIAAVLVVIVLVAAFALSDRPDWSTDLVALPAAPGAAARVDGWLTAEGTRMRFDVSGLPAAAPDRYYEIWLSAEDGTHVSAGSFRSSGTIEVFIGVARSEYPRVWITLEETDDDLGPSGVTVLDDPQW